MAVKSSMRPRAISLFVFALLIILTVPAAHADDYVPGEVLVQFRLGTNVDAITKLLGLRILARSRYAFSFRLGVPLGRNIDALVSFLRLSPLVIAADPNLIMGALDTAGQQWTSTFNGGDGPAEYQGQSAISLVDYRKAANGSAGSGVTVAILDTGISSKHAFLAAQMVSGWNFVDNNANPEDAPNGLDDNGNGQIDEGTGHGTMVAGIIYRFAPKSWLMPVKVLNSDGTGTLWDAVEGIRYSVANGATVLNLSFGSPRNSGMMTQALHDAHDADAVIVTSAGNDNSSTPQFPAGDPSVLTVAALRNDKTKASFSNYGAAIDIAAPGTYVVSTFWDGRYAAWSGTSFSAPMAAAEAALIRSIAIGMDVDAVRNLILSTSNSVNAWNPNYVNQLGKKGAGLIDMDAAVSKL
jgi:subtilisin family serine protease